MEVRVADQDRLLYKLRFYRAGDTLFVSQVSGKNQDERCFGILNGELFEILKKDKFGLSYQKSEFFGDSLNKIRDYDAKKNLLHLTESRFSDGKLDTKSVFKQKGAGKQRLISTEKYHYTDKLLSLVEKYSRAGNLLESTTYLYNIDNSLAAISNKTEATKKLVSFNYDEKALINKKTLIRGNNTYTIHYYRSDDEKITGFLVDGLNNAYNDEIFLMVNSQNQLSRIQHDKKHKNIPAMDKTAEILFDYQPNGNIESIRIYGVQGRLTKNINFEYAYFNL
jgi:hypothetical protein